MFPVLHLLSMNSKKKILIIPSWYPSKSRPGLGTFFREQAQLLTNRFDIRILHGTRKDIGRMKKIINLLNYLLRLPITITFSSGYLLEPPRAYHFFYEYSLNILKKINYNRIIRYYLVAYSKLQKDGWVPDLIHAHDTFLAGIVASRIARRSGIPYIITEHNYLQLNFPDYVRNDFISAMERSSRVLLVSYYQLKNLLMHFIRCRSVVIGNMVDEDHFNIKESSPHERFEVLTVGRAAYHKDYDTFFKVVLEIARRGTTDIHFTVVGNGVAQLVEKKSHTEREIIMKYCSFVDYVPRETMPQYYHQCDVFLSTSVAETFGLAACEALFCGRPVVSTDNGGVDEMIAPGNQMVVKIRDINALAEALLKIKNNEVIFDPETIRASVMNKFSKHAFRNSLMEVYQAAITNNER